MNQRAGAPVDISAAMAWAAKYVEPNGFCVFHPAGSDTSAPASSRRRTRSPANAASGSLAQSAAGKPNGLVKTDFITSLRFTSAPGISSIPFPGTRRRLEAREVGAALLLEDTALLGRE